MKKVNALEFETHGYHPFRGSFKKASRSGSPRETEACTSAFVMLDVTRTILLH